MSDTIGIWWLASYPKSGNTWARMVINSAVSGFPPDINAGFQYVVGDFGASFYGCTAAVPVDKMTDEDVLSYRLAALRNQLAMFPLRDHCLKTHHACVVAQEVPLIPTWLTKGAVYLVRDPRDVCVSLSKHMGITIDNAIEFMDHPCAVIQREETIWKHFTSSWSAHVESWLDDKNPIGAVCVKYEDLIVDPQRHFRRLLTGLGLYDVSDRQLCRAIRRCGVQHLRSQEEKRGFKERSRHYKTFFGTGSGWQNVLTPEQAERIENDHGSIMKELGYKIGVRHDTRNEYCHDACESSVGCDC